MPGRVQFGLGLGGALLYTGPVLAGWAGLGWPAVLCLALVFVGWLLAMRIEFRPGYRDGWASKLALAALVQLVLVTAVYGAGVVLSYFVPQPQSLAAIAGIPVVLLISVFGIAVARTVYTPITPEAEAEIGEMIDALEREVERFHDAVEPDSSNTDEHGPEGKK